MISPLAGVMDISDSDGEKTPSPEHRMVKDEIHDPDASKLPKPKRVATRQANLVGSLDCTFSIISSQVPALNCRRNFSGRPKPGSTGWWRRNRKGKICRHQPGCRPSGRMATNLPLLASSSTRTSTKYLPCNFVCRTVMHSQMPPDLPDT